MTSLAEILPAISIAETRSTDSQATESEGIGHAKGRL
jgi:hypothetical protein